MKVIVPKENVNDEEVVVQKINFKSKDRIKKNDHVLDLETSKTAIEITSPCDGFLDLKVAQGDEIPVGSLLFEVLESLDGIESKRKDNSSKVDTKNYIFTKDAKDKIEQLGLKNFYFDKKMVTLDDVLNFVDSKESKNLNNDAHIDQKKSNEPLKTKDSNLNLPNTSYEKIKHTLRKRSEIKNLSSNGNVSTQSIIGIRINTLPNRSYEVPYLFRDSIADLVTYEGSILMNEFPELNSFYINEKEYGQYKCINAGFSFDNVSNLKVLSIKNSNNLKLSEVQNSILKLLDLYESNKPIDEETLTSSTFTISDLSNSKVDYMMPLVSNNQSSIIGITKQNNSFMVYVGFDHKVTSGLYVSRYLEKLKEHIEAHFYNEDAINYLKCSKCEMPATEAKSLGNSGFLKMINFDGDEVMICENCFNGF